MQSRWTRVLVITLAMCGTCAPSLPSAPARAATQGVPNLEETLRVVLRPRSPEQQAFLKLVVAKVDDGSLPIETVRAVMLWVRKKHPYKNSFSYFEFGLRRIAEKQGIDLD